MVEAKCNSFRWTVYRISHLCHINSYSGISRDDIHSALAVARAAMHRLASANRGYSCLGNPLLLMSLTSPRTISMPGTCIWNLLHQYIGTLFHYAEPFTGSSPKLKIFPKWRTSIVCMCACNWWGFTTFLQRILCRHWFRGRSYITWVVSTGGQLIWWIWASIARKLP